MTSFQLSLLRCSCTRALGRQRAATALSISRLSTIYRSSWRGPDASWSLAVYVCRTVYRRLIGWKLVLRSLVLTAPSNGYAQTGGITACSITVLCKAMCEAPDWHGPAYQTLANAAYVGKRFDQSSVTGNFPSTHHSEVAALHPLDAKALLDWAMETIAETGRRRSSDARRADVGGGITT